MDEQLKAFIALWDALHEGRKERFLRYLIQYYGVDKRGRKNLLSFMNLIQIDEDEDNF